METTTATERQISYARTLVRDRDWTDRLNGNLFERAMDCSESEQTRFIGKRECSDLIDALLRCPKHQVTPGQGGQPEIGVYVLEDGTLVQAKPNRQRTNVYTKVWVSISGKRLTLTDEDVHGEWQYAPEYKGRVRPELKMTAEQAERFGIVYGQCARCGRHLKDATSVREGIGPVCRKYFGM